MDNETVAPRLMSLHFLEEITNSFSTERKIGAGSYGTVYKGEKNNGETIAVKVLHYIPGLDDEQFEKEYLNLASLQHKNVVRLTGYCHETRREFQPFNGKTVLVEVTKRALCFQYMHNGGLDKYLSDEFSGHDWLQRYAIIKGICHGLKYLHEELQCPMYHLDLKPANVLMDENMDPKLADFGLSRLFGGEQTQMSTSAIGTRGYIPPEYIDGGIISNKFDIFSLGVVIIKIMTGPTGYYRSEEMSSQDFIELVHANWMKRLHESSLYLVDSYSKQVKRCIEIAIRCVEVDRRERPTIGVVVTELNETETMTQDWVSMAGVIPLAPGRLIINKPNETTTQIQFSNKDMASSINKICHCISTEKGLMDNPLNKLISYPLDVIDNRGMSHETIISTVCHAEYGPSTFEPICPKIKIIDIPEDFGSVSAIDVHPTEPWILVGHWTNKVSIWNHRTTQERLMTFEIANDVELLVCAVRFIARKKWFIAGDANGDIHVYTYTKKYKLKQFKAHTSWINSLAVHQTSPFVVSSNDNQIKLWNWENRWQCIRTFEAHTESVESVRFNPLPTSNNFASASRDGTIKIWSLFLDNPVATLECGTAELVSVHYFLVNGNEEYILAGSEDGTAHVWDLAKETCIQHVKELQVTGPGIAVVDCLSTHPIIVTVSHDHIVSFCNSTTHRYKYMVDFKLGTIEDFSYIKDPRSLVLGCTDGIAIMEIN